ncbi:MAG: hypothetical protein ICV63_06565 [Coleofasciculus sp. Co-bin14]|nr:hypothetical protein [Coleofasciculus sp. Co-bin14]
MLSVIDCSQVSLSGRQSQPTTSDPTPYHLAHWSLSRLSQQVGGILNQIDRFIQLGSCW